MHHQHEFMINATQALHGVLLAVAAADGTPPPRR